MYYGGVLGYPPIPIPAGPFAACSRARSSTVATSATNQALSDPPSVCSLPTHAPTRASAAAISRSCLRTDGLGARLLCSSAVSWRRSLDALCQVGRGAEAVDAKCRGDTLCRPDCGGRPAGQCSRMAWRGRRKGRWVAAAQHNIAARRARAGPKSQGSAVRLRGRRTHKRNLAAVVCQGCMLCAVKQSTAQARQPWLNNPSDPSSTQTLAKPSLTC